MIADADQEWVYIESGDVRGFVRTDYLQQGKEALEYVTSTGEDQMNLRIISSIHLKMKHSTIKKRLYMK